MNSLSENPYCKQLINPDREDQVKKNKSEEEQVGDDSLIINLEVVHVSTDSNDTGKQAADDAKKNSKDFIASGRKIYYMITQR